MPELASPFDCVERSGFRLVFSLATYVMDHSENEEDSAVAEALWDHVGRAILEHRADFGASPYDITGEA